MTEQAFEECMAAIRKGDREGLRRLYEAYLSHIYAICCSVLKNKEDAENVTSDFFLRIWYTADRFQAGNGHKAYLAAIARNMCIDYIRKHRREIPSDFSGGDEENENRLANAATVQKKAASVRWDGADYGNRPGSSGQMTTEGFADQVATGIVLQQALQTLSEEQREVIQLKVGMELTFREIAELLHLPMGTVTWRYREAIRKLRRYGFDEGSEN